jgi:hypothetical protein
MHLTGLRRVSSVALVSGAVTAVTVATRTGAVGTQTLAATARSVGDGRLWLLATSAFVADRPAVPSIAGLALVGVVAVCLLGGRTAWTAAALGHLGSALFVYAALDLAVALHRPGAERASTLPDFGTSAVIASWVGALAAYGWQRREGMRARAMIAAGACACGLIGWLLRPDLTVLDTEHLVAFAVGAALVAGATRRTRLPQVVVS